MDEETPTCKHNVSLIDWVCEDKPEGAQHRRRTLSDLLPRKTMRLNIEMVTTLKEVTVPVLEWKQSMADTLEKAKLTIEVDGEPALHIPEFTTFEIRPGYLEIEKRLTLLEEVLRSADVTGMALVRRVPGGYEVIPSDTYVLMSNDPDDKD